MEESKFEIENQEGYMISQNHVLEIMSREFSFDKLFELTERDINNVLCEKGMKYRGFYEYYIKKGLDATVAFQKVENAGFLDPDDNIDSLKNEMSKFLLEAREERKKDVIDLVKEIKIHCSQNSIHEEGRIEEYKKTASMAKALFDGVKVGFSYHETDMLRKKDVEKLVELDGVAKVNIEVDQQTVDLGQVFEADEKADMLVSHIKSLNLSPFEKFILIHDFCAGKPYKDSYTKDPRAFVTSMTQDSIVCAGYASLMTNLCQRLGIECEYYSSADERKSEQDNRAGHAFNIVKLKDPKYNIDGEYLCDACWDTSTLHRGLRDYSYLALPFQDVKYDEHKFFMDEEKYKDSPVIPFETLKEAITNAHMAIEDKDYVEEFVRDSLDATVQYSHARMSKGQNAFSSKYRENINNNNNNFER